MSMNLKVLKYLIFSLIMMALCACGTQSHSDDKNTVDFASLSKTGELKLSYAGRYSVSEYGDYYLASFDNDTNLLIVPEGEDIPQNLPNNTSVVTKPIKNAYIASSSIMDMIDSLGALDGVKFVSTKEDGWYLENIIGAMEDGRLTYVGKYNQPDYEQLLSGGCDFAIENTMIWHNPEAKEKLEELNIPVMVELSSYEEHPLGRLEWIKLYGILFDKEDEAEKIFDEQVSGVEELTEREPTGKTVAYFYITSNGIVNIKKPTDYVPKMIEMAGGVYLPESISEEEENALSTSNMQFEEFYAKAKDADILIYNSLTTGDVASIDDIVSKNALMADFKAIERGNVYLSGADFFQNSTGVLDMVSDLSKVMNEEDSDLKFLRKLN